MQTVLANLLLAHDPLAALIGNRVYWDELPQGQPHPAIVMHLVFGAPSYHMAGPSGLVESRVQFDCRGGTSAEARAVADALEVRLSGFRGDYEGVRFGGAFLVLSMSRSDKTDAMRWFTAKRDFQIWSARAA